MGKILTVVVTYNRLSLLKEAIKSLQQQTYLSDILVVNNGSTDGTTEWLNSQKDLLVIEQENVGGAGGFFTGLKYASDNEYDFVWAMDDDIVALPDTLSELLRGYDFLCNRGEKIGVLASLVLDSDSNPVNVPSLLTNKINETGYPNWPKFLSYGIVPIAMATFVSLLIPIPVIKEIGLPIKEFFIWGDDTEYTLRIARKFTNYYIGNSKIFHLRNGGILSLDNISDPERIKMFSRFIRNHGFLFRKKYMDNRKLSYLRFILRNMKKAIKFGCSGEWLKMGTILIGIKDSFSFNPKIQYP